MNGDFFFEEIFLYGKKPNKVIYIFLSSFRIIPLGVSCYGRDRETVYIARICNNLLCIDNIFLYIIDSIINV